LIANIEIGPNLLTLTISVIPLSMLSMAVNNYLKMRAMSGQLLSQKSEELTSNVELEA